MRTLFLLGIVSLSLISCGDSHESLLKEELYHKDKLAEALESVDANTKADDLSAKIKPIVESLKDINKSKKALGEQSAEQIDQVMAKFEEERARVTMRLGKAVMAASKHEAARKIVEDAMRDI
jgi:hypothetical protein